MIAKTRVLAVLKTSLALFQVQRIFDWFIGQATLLLPSALSLQPEISSRFSPTLLKGLVKAF